MSKRDNRESGLLNAAGVPYAEIIRSKRKEAGLNQEELGSMACVGKNAVGAWESGRSRPDLSSVPIICDALGMSLNDFFGIRKGEDNPSSSCVPDSFAERYLKLSDYHRTIVLHEMDALLELQEKEAAQPRRRFLRIFSNELAACAGPSYSIGETDGEYVWLEDTPLTRQADEMIRVNGDSMKPDFLDGDQVLVRHTDTLRPGEVGIFTNGDAGYIKVYQRDGLHSLNPAYPVMKFAEGEDVRCVGKVLGIVNPQLFANDDELNSLYERQKG